MSKEHSKPGRRSAGAGGVWFREPHRGRSVPTLTRQRIVAAAVDLLDEEGLGRLTVRRLAQRLDAGATSLYWHVKSKEDILDLAVDEVFGEVPIPAGRDDWRATLAEFLTAWKDAALRHPWTAGLWADRPLIGPHALRRTEFLHATLARAGFTGSRLPAAVYSLSNYLIGFVTTHVTRNATIDPEQAHASNDYIRRQKDTYPFLASNLEALDDWDLSFAWGLEFLLDGLEQARARPAPP